MGACPSFLVTAWRISRSTNLEDRTLAGLRGWTEGVGVKLTMVGTAGMWLAGAVFELVANSSTYMPCLPRSCGNIDS
jgi:hypothetical protein